jgi:phosphoglycolate phosphatase
VSHGARVTRLAVFDLDGTLIDSRLDLCLAVNHALRTVGLPERTLEEVSGFVGEGAVRLVERAVAPRRDLLDAALAAWWEHYQAHLLDHTVLYPGLEALLASATFPLAVHTNKPGRLARRILQGLGVARHFAEVLGGDEAPRKPDPAGTRALLGRLAVAPEEAVYVGDSVIDAELARAVPMRLVAVTWGLVPEARLRSAGAGTLLRRAEELLPWVAGEEPAPPVA